MTRAQFLNDLYRRLGSLSREQAEQHLTYYAEMLADRMEEGMTEEEAVASMEDVGTIAQRILQDEGSSKPAAPPKYPSLSGVQPVRAASTAERPNRKLNWRKPAKYALWGLAVLLVAGMLINRFAGGGSENRAKLLEGDASVKEDFPIDRSSSHYGINIGPDGIEIGDGISIGPDGVEIGDGDHGLYVGPDGIEVNGETMDWHGWHNWDDWDDWDNWDSWEEWTDPDDYTFHGTDYDVPASGITDVKIEWTAGLVQIQASDQADSISFYEVSTGELTSKTQLVYKVEDETLHIRFAKPNVTIRDSKMLVAYIPDNWLDELEVETTSAGAAISHLSVESLEVDTTSGCVALSGVSAQSVEVTTTSGDVILDSVTTGTLDMDTTSGNIGGTAVTKELKADTTSGDVTVQAESCTKYRLDSVSGNLCAALMGAGPFDVELETVSGDMILTMPEQLGFSLAFETLSGSIDSGGFSLSGGGGKYVCGSGASQIEVDSVSGSLKLVQS